MTSIDDTLYASLLQGCPKCGTQSGFYAGPRGGISQNIFCKNSDCRMSFNVTKAIRLAEPLGIANPHRYKFVIDRYGETWEA